MEMNLLESLVHTARTDGVIPVDVFMSGVRTDNANLGWNEYTFFGEGESTDDKDDKDENLIISNVFSN